MRAGRRVWPAAFGEVDELPNGLAMTDTTRLPPAFLVLLLLLSCAMVLGIQTGPALSDPVRMAASDRTAEGTPQDVTSTIAPSNQASKNELNAGGIRAEIGQAPANALFSAGSSVFTEITLTNDGAAQDVLADLVLEAERGEIKSVTGKNVSRAEDSTTHVVRVDKLKKGKPRKIVVETALLSETPASGTTGESRLVVTLRKPSQPEYETKIVETPVKKSYCRRYGTTRTWSGTRRRCVRWGKRTVTRRKEVRVPVINTAAAAEPVPSDTTVLVWSVSNCAQAFHAELTKLMETKGARMGDALKAARARDRSRPGSWMFKPSMSGGSGRNCVSRKRYWDSRRGRYRSRCTRYEDEESAGTESGTPTKEVRAVNRLANTFVRSRGIDPEMSTRRNYGWVSQKAATDLRGYLKQDPHPAICTGAIQFVDYFDGRLGDFFKRGDSFSKSAQTARTVAAEQVAAARKTIDTDPSGHPAWGATPIGFAKAKGDPNSSLQILVVDVASLTSDSELVAEVKNSGDAYGALKTMNSWMKQDGKEVSDDSRKAMRRALAAIEAADYLQVVAGHYDELRDTLKGSIVAVRDAHGRHCRCDS